jgi:hypothetical protein
MSPGALRRGGIGERRDVYKIMKIRYKPKRLNKGIYEGGGEKMERNQRY